MKAKPSLIVFDVGHGSCVFLQDGAITTVIDCKNSTLFIEFLLSRNIRTISQVIISHADADHIDGILALIQSDYVQLGTVFVNADASKDSETWMDLRIALQDASTRGKLKVQTEIGDGMAHQLQHDAVRIEVVAP
jgi:competence protein ComEC